MGTAGRKVDGDLAQCLHGIGVEQGAMPAGDGGDGRNILQYASFVIGQHHGDQCSVLLQQGFQCGKINLAILMDRRLRHFPATAQQRLHGLAHRRVFDRATYPLRRRVRGGNALDRGVVGLSPATGKRDLRRVRADRRGDLLSRQVNRLACRATKAVTAGRVPLLAAQIR